MARAGVSGPVIGLPPGVEIGPLGSRFLAYVIDRSVPAVVGGLASVLIVQLPNQRTLVAVLSALVGVDPARRHRHRPAVHDHLPDPAPAPAGLARPGRGLGGDQGAGACPAK